MSTVSTISHKPRAEWRYAQAAVWLCGVSLLITLFLAPETGAQILWNILIPIAPLLLVLTPGAWRNLCPLATTTLLPHRLNISARKQISPRTQSVLQLIGVLLLVLIVPLRHVILDTSGIASGVVILLLAGAGILSGLFFKLKSGWCSTLCPLHPVEKLYGFNPAVTTVNAQCTLCENCVAPCPDSTQKMHPLKTRNGGLHKLVGKIIVGGFPGFVWGWFQVRDYSGLEGWSHLPEAYLWPVGGLVVSLLLYLLLERILPSKASALLPPLFGFAALACYYWFRIPMLVGFGPFPGDGTLIDLSMQLPTWFPAASQVTTTLLCAWLLFGLNRNRKHSGGNTSWSIRPSRSTL